MNATIFKKFVIISGLKEKCRSLLIFVQLFEEHNMESRLRREYLYILPVLLVLFQLWRLELKVPHRLKRCCILKHSSISSTYQTAHMLMNKLGREWLIINHSEKLFVRNEAAAILGFLETWNPSQIHIKFYHMWKGRPLKCQMNFWKRLAFKNLSNLACSPQVKLEKWYFFVFWYNKELPGGMGFFLSKLISDVQTDLFLLICGSCTVDIKVFKRLYSHLSISSLVQCIFKGT